TPPATARPRRGWRSPATRPRATATSPATPTWRRAWPTPRGSTCRGTSPCPPRRPTPSSRGGARPPPARAGFARPRSSPRAGGAAGGAWTPCRNLVITMTLGGLWHGAAWPFVLWGLYHGLLLAAYRVVPLPRWLGRPWARPLAVGCTFVSFCVGLAIFRCQTLA